MNQLSSRPFFGWPNLLQTLRNPAAFSFKVLSGGPTSQNPFSKRVVQLYSRDARLS